MKNACAKSAGYALAGSARAPPIIGLGDCERGGKEERGNAPDDGAKGPEEAVGGERKGLIVGRGDLAEDGVEDGGDAGEDARCGRVSEAWTAGGDVPSAREKRMAGSDEAKASRNVARARP